MTLRLVTDNEDPTGPDYGNIPEMLRQYAAEIEAGQYGEPISVTLVVERKEDDLMLLGCGEEPSHYELIGLMEVAKLTAIAELGQE